MDTLVAAVVVVVVATATIVVAVAAAAVVFLSHFWDHYKSQNMRKEDRV